MHRKISMVSTSMCFTLAAMILAGCVSQRKSAVPSVADVGLDVATKHRYNLTCIFNGETPEPIEFDRTFMAECQPSVFAADGLSIFLRVKFKKLESPFSWTTLLSLCTLTLVPEERRWESSFECSVALVDDANVTTAFEMLNVVEHACSMLAPTAFLLYDGNVTVRGHHVFSERTQYISSGNTLMDIADPVKLISNEPQFQRAVAYAIAVKLKNLEESGRIETVLQKRVQST